MTGQAQSVPLLQGITYEMGAVTVDPGSSAYDPRPLIPYLKELGVPYFYEQQGMALGIKICQDMRRICVKSQPLPPKGMLVVGM